MYRRAVSTFQGVKSDGIFSFQPPLNIVALAILWPARLFVTPHQYHKIIVFCARVSNLPLLLAIRFVERNFLYREHSGERHPWLRLSTYKLDFFGGARTELSAVFELEEDIDDDFLPGGAFDIHDGVMTPAPVEHEDQSRFLHGSDSGNRGGDARSRGRSPSGGGGAHHSNNNKLDIGSTPPASGSGNKTAEERERSRQRRTQSMSDWGGTLGSSSTIRSRPTILSKLYGFNRRDDSPDSTFGRARFGNNSSNNQHLNGRLGALWESQQQQQANTEMEEQREQEREEFRERLDRIDEGQKRIEEALRGMGGGD